MKKIILTLGMAVVATVFCAYAEVPVKVLRQRDTTYSAKLNLICQTDPQAKAFINGEEVHVYKTGAFGLPITLEEGDNTIKVKAVIGAETKEMDVNIFYKKNAPGRHLMPSLPRNEARKMLAYGLSKEGANLQFGTGTDRLGGSKMGYIASGIPLTIVESINNLYKIQLSENRTAYLDKDDVQLCDDILVPGTVNTGSIRVSNTGKYDRVYVSLPSKLPYASWVELDPTTINIELFGATNNSNWITQVGKTDMIDWVEVRQVESDIARVVIRLKQQYAWGYDVDYDGTGLVIKVKHTPNPTLKGLVVGLDAGHGGEDSPGAISNTGIKESEVNLSIVYALKSILESKGATVVLSRKEDVGVSMAERRKIFKDAEVDIMISVHNNAGGSPFSALGTSTYYKYISNRELASCLLDRMLELGVSNYGLTGNFNFSLGTPIQFPNALVEGLFMDSLEEEEKLADPEYRKLMATKIAAGLEDYLLKVKKSLKK